MFKKSLLIIGLAISLNTQTNPLNWKNTVRGVATVSALTITYAAFSLSFNKYLTHKGFNKLELDDTTRALTAFGLLLACAPVAKLFEHAETIK